MTPPPQVALIGRDRTDASYFWLLREGERYVLWGFNGSPDAMTALGRQLFLIAVHWLASGSPYRTYLPLAQRP